MEDDATSIALCRQLLTEMMEAFLNFDFRNGNLRRRFDGLKYALRRVEDLAYEMSIAMGHAALLKGSETRIFNLPSESVKDFAEYTAKKCSRTTQKTRLSSAEAAELTSGSCADIQEEKRLDSNLESLVDKRSFNAIRGRMEAYDKLRERVIKDSRDVQKLSKQAIFAVHRGALVEAKRKLLAAAEAARPISAIVDAHEGLAAGAFSNSIEEWVEVCRIRLQLSSLLFTCNFW